MEKSESVWSYLLMICYNCSCRDLVHKLGASLVQSYYQSTSYDELVEVSVTDGNDASLYQIWIISGVH